MRRLRTLRLDEHGPQQRDVDGTVQSRLVGLLQGVSQSRMVQRSVLQLGTATNHVLRAKERDSERLSPKVKDGKLRVGVPLRCFREQQDGTVPGRRYLFSLMRGPDRSHGGCRFRRRQAAESQGVHDQIPRSQQNRDGDQLGSRMLFERSRRRGKLGQRIFHEVHPALRNRRRLLLRQVSNYRIQSGKRYTERRRMCMVVHQAVEPMRDDRIRLVGRGHCPVSDEKTRSEQQSHR